MWLGVALGLLALGLGSCRGPTRHTYRVTDEQLQQMGQLAGIPPCPQGPTIVAAVKRAGRGGVVHVACPGAGKGLPRPPSRGR